MAASDTWEKLRRKDYREEFVAAQARRAIPFQIRAMMRAKGISQQELATRAGLTQGVISRAANPAYGKLTLNTIIRVAAGFDVAFIGRFVPFSELTDYFDGFHERHLGDVPSFDDECALAAEPEARRATRGGVVSLADWRTATASIEQQQQALGELADAPPSSQGQDGGDARRDLLGLVPKPSMLRAALPLGMQQSSLNEVADGRRN